ncbi:major facilitator superfamily domain-containing protein [Terfezia claveryi]|nr:major facilitator superfamily domain-containing protein [Terfezia claveryi]
MRPLREPEQSARRRVQVIAFCSAMLNCLCAGSLLLFSLWAPIFQDKLGFSQLQINGISIAAEVGMYIPVPIFGAVCDKYGPAKLSLLSAMFFGPAYLLAAHAFTNNLPFHVMLLAFVLIGCGTSSMYFSGVTTCAKNFTGNSRGIALALPIAAFGLSSLWEAQFVSRAFGGEGGNGQPGGVNVARAFVFFAGLLTSVGLLGGCGLTILPEVKGQREDVEDSQETNETAPLLRETAVMRARGYGTGEDGQVGRREIGKKKGWLNESTRMFLIDPTMYLFAAGVFLTTGPGESFINNMGTIIRSLYTPDTAAAAPSIPIHLKQQNHISTATHVSIIALTSTIARLIAGSLSDYLAPTLPVGPPPPHAAEPGYLGWWKKYLSRKPTVSRMWLLIGFAGLMCMAQLFVAAGGVDQAGERFWLVSSAMGAGYGAVFTLAPTIVSLVWGVENFGTNWGIIAVTPAVGATLYGVVFAMNYDNAGKAQEHILSMLGAYYHQIPNSAEGLLSMTLVDAGDGAPPAVCYGKECYDVAFWVMGGSVAVACGFWALAWKGWRARGAVV